jgi:hypothetical protein
MTAENWKAERKKTQRILRQRRAKALLHDLNAPLAKPRPVIDRQPELFPVARATAKTQKGES